MHIGWARRATAARAQLPATNRSLKRCSDTVILQHSVTLTAQVLARSLIAKVISLFEGADFDDR